MQKKRIKIPSVLGHHESTESARKVGYHYFLKYLEQKENDTRDTGE